MGYMGFGMRKEVYDRKPRQPFAHQKELSNKEPVLKGVELGTKEIPTEPIIQPPRPAQRAWHIARAVLGVLAIAYAITFIALLIAAAME